MSAPRPASPPSRNSTISRIWRTAVATAATTVLRACPSVASRSAIPQPVVPPTVALGLCQSAKRQPVGLVHLSNVQSCPGPAPLVQTASGKTGACGPSVSAYCSPCSRGCSGGCARLGSLASTLQAVVASGPVHGRSYVHMDCLPELYGAHPPGSSRGADSERSLLTQMCVQRLYGAGKGSLPRLPTQLVRCATGKLLWNEFSQRLGHPGMGCISQRSRFRATV